MPPSTQIVIRPDDLHRAAADMGDGADQVRTRLRVVGRASASVTLNRHDPGFSPAGCASNRAIIDRALQTAATEMDADSDLMARTADEALAGDVVGSATRIDELSAEIRAWDGSENDPRLDELVRQRNQLVAGISSDDGPVSEGALRRHVEAGGSMAKLFLAASGGDGAVHAATEQLLTAGQWNRADRFDTAAAVAQLILADIEGDQLDQFEARAAAGLDVGVAATTTRLGLGPLSAADLLGLADRTTAAFEPGTRGWGGLTAEDLAWLPLPMRAALEQRRDDQRGGNRIRSSVWIPAFRGGADRATTQVEVLAEFGRAGVDEITGGKMFAEQLIDLALGDRTSADLRVHSRIAAAVADPDTGLSLPFYATLTATGTAALPDLVMSSTYPSSRVAASTDQAKLDTVGQYGRGLAAAERSSMLGFDADDLFAHAGAHSPAYYFAGDAHFDQDFVIDAATAVLSELSPDMNGLADPRALLLDEVNGHGLDARLELLDSLEHKLGDDYLANVLWPPVRIEPLSTERRHPVGELIAPIINTADARPDLAAAIIETAAAHTDVPYLETANVVQHAIMSDVLLIAPEHGPVFGRPVDIMGHCVSEQDIVDVMERVFLAGSGGDLLLYMGSAVPMVTTAAYESGGLHAITDEFLELQGELVGKMRAAFANARLTIAIDADFLIDNVKLYGSSVATAFAGVWMSGAAVSLVAGTAFNIGIGHLANILDANNVENMLNIIRLEEDGQSSEYRSQVVHTLDDLETLPAVTGAMLDGFTSNVRVMIDGKDAGSLSEWQDSIASIESRSFDHTSRFVREQP